MNLIPVFNKNSPRAHRESELDMLGVHGKLVKYVVHLSKKKIEFFSFFFTQAAQTATDQFLVSRNFRGQVTLSKSHLSLIGTICPLGIN
jgi:hypothetical protein